MSERIKKEQIKINLALLPFYTNYHICFASRKLGASEGTINQEIQRYQQLESVAVNDIRRDVRKKLRRSSMRVSKFKKNFVRVDHSFIFYFMKLCDST